MKLGDIKRVAVIGPGTMGSQIAQVFSQVGRYSVAVYDLHDELLDQGIRSIRETCSGILLKKGL